MTTQEQECRNKISEVDTILEKMKKDYQDSIADFVARKNALLTKLGGILENGKKATHSGQFLNWFEQKMKESSLLRKISFDQESFAAEIIKNVKIDFSEKSIGLGMQESGRDTTQYKLRIEYNGNDTVVKLKFVTEVSEYPRWQGQCDIDGSAAIEIKIGDKEFKIEESIKSHKNHNKSKIPQIFIFETDEYSEEDYNYVLIYNEFDTFISELAKSALNEKKCKGSILMQKKHDMRS
jgi:hypothetical protein